MFYLFIKVYHFSFSTKKKQAFHSVTQVWRRRTWALVLVMLVRRFTRTLKTQYSATEPHVRGILLVWTNMDVQVHFPHGGNRLFGGVVKGIEMSSSSAWPFHLTQILPELSIRSCMMFTRCTESTQQGLRGSLHNHLIQSFHLVRIIVHF